MKSPEETEWAQWTTSACPFTIHYSIPVLDDVRLGVVDAFFSLPKGGVEIGGILLGDYRDGRVTIRDSASLECEHATGPSFVLSGADEAKLTQQLDSLKRGRNGPVGWYHSHTRSGIFLSDADLRLYQRFFPEPWQVALVLKPHILEPTRAGFFFRDSTGAVQASASHQEFQLQPSVVQPIPGAQPARISGAPRRTPVIEKGPVLDTTLADATTGEPAVPEPVIAKPHELSPAAAAANLVDAPKFEQAQSHGFRRWPGFAAAIFGLALGAGGYVAYQHREKLWSLAVKGEARETSAPQGKGRVELSAIDSGGQLQIRWDRGAAAVRGGSGAILTITDGEHPPQAIPLDAAHLEAGTFTYARRSGHVDVALAIRGPNGAEMGGVTTFLGPPPPDSVPAEDAGARMQRDALVQEAAKLKTDLNKQVERTKQLEKTVLEIKLEMLRKRMAAQIPDDEKK
jgi:proteasome lid subunit RPN8/RPN11